MVTDEQIVAELIMVKAEDDRPHVRMRNKRLSAGMCCICGKEPFTTGQTCIACKEVVSKRNRDSRSARRDKGLCHKCNSPAVKGFTHCEQHMEYARQRWRDIRQQVLDHYGNKCTCCGETIPEFLSIDHINGGGNGHRKSLEANGMKKHHGTGFYKWLIDNEYPEGFQLLCHNCNFAKGHYGKCPHEEVDSVSW